MRYISLFSGIEAASCAWEPLGMEPVAFCEIDPFPSAVLAHRFPNVPNLGDIREVDWSEWSGAVDVVVGGSPCQSFSVAAGAGRTGLEGASGLMLEYVRAVSEIMPRFVVWENVPGCLSSGRGGEKGADFGCLLRSLEELGYGVCWRVLDSQFFGVAQRRERVFLVGELGARPPVEVLFEPEGLLWDFESGREKRKAIAGNAEDRLGNSGGPTDGCMTPWDVQSKRVFSEDSVMPTLSSGTNEGMNIQPIIAMSYHARASSGSAAVSEDGLSPTLTADWHSPAVAFAQNTRDEVRYQGDGDICGALSAKPGMKQQTCVVQTGHTRQNGCGYSDGAAYTLDSASPQAVVCMADDATRSAVDVDLCGTLKRGGGTPFVALPSRTGRT